MQEMDIHSKETKHTRKSSMYNSRKNSIFHKISQYSTSATNRIQDEIEYKIQNTGKQQHTQKQQNTNTRRMLLPGIEPEPSSL
jgi:hypothetical protein